MGPWGQPRVIDYEHGGILSANESLVLALSDSRRASVRGVPRRPGARSARRQRLCLSRRPCRAPAGWPRERRIPERRWRLGFQREGQGCPRYAHSVRHHPRGSAAQQLSALRHAYCLLLCICRRQRDARPNANRSCRPRPRGGSGSGGGGINGRTPHILYAPLVVDWSGAKLSKSLYVRDGGGYGGMELFGTDGLAAYDKSSRGRLKTPWSPSRAALLRRPTCPPTGVRRRSASPSAHRPSPSGSSSRPA